MAIIKQVQVQCQVQCDICDDIADVTWETVGMVRHTVKNDGWTYRNGRDICCYCNETYERDDA